MGGKIWLARLLLLYLMEEENEKYAPVHGKLLGIVYCLSHS